MDLSLNTKAFISQRLIPRETGIGRVAAMEIMLNSPLIADLIFKGEVGQIKEIMAKSTRLGMQTFDQALFSLYEDGIISYEEAMRNADSKNEIAVTRQARIEARNFHCRPANGKFAHIGRGFRTNFFKRILS